MSSFRAPVRFFLGSNTPTGFVDTAKTLYKPDGWRVYLLKSGAGTGKSTLLRRVYEQLTAEGEEAEAFCCSSDPDSLDAVRFPARQLCLIDATAPHSVEPLYWGTVEQLVPLSQCMSNSLRENAPAIMALTDENRSLHRRCRGYLRAAASLLRESRRIQRESLNRDKLCRYAHHLAASEWQSDTVCVQLAACERRFLSAFTPEGWITFYDTLQALCPRIYAVEDEQGAAASLLLSELQQAAVADGKHCIACPCPLFPDEGPEHLLLPELGLAFTTSNSFHKVDFPIFRRIHASRFLDTEQLRHHRQVLSFRRRAAMELLQEAASLSAQAKEIHDQLEQYSVAAMDWQRYEQLATELLKNI
ncbi:MAG: hypothetical protein IKU56_03290 [Clostridia bacterium]|nr:hypothetical protein [Clostridia bacterium]